ncbi:MAG: response regulator [Polyangiales bacterium]
MQRASDGAPSRALVWIVDDSPLETELAATALSLRFDVETFQDGHSALERLASRRAPDTLVLDWLLPDISGVDVCRFLRSNAATTTLPVLVLSVRRDPADVLEGLSAGADDYLSKPFDPAELLARVSVLVRARQHLDRAERAERALRSLLEHLPDVVLALDDRRRVTFINSEADRLLGLARSAIVGRVVTDLLPDLSLDSPATGDALPDLRWRGRVFAPFVRPLPAQSLATTVLVLRDVTRDRVSAEVARLADQRKDEFLAMLGHELRNPLAAIVSASELLTRLPGDEAATTHARQILGRQTALMARLIDDLLDVSRITQGKIELRREPFDLRTAVARALETMHPTLVSRRHHVESRVSDEPLPVFGDPTRVEQVVMNLLHNAAKYTPPGGRIRVTTAREGHEAVLRVRDNGVGIPPEALSQIFDLFTQVETSLARTQGGLGIGLTLVRSLVAMHGGSIEAHSEGPDKGSEFDVRLPLSDLGSDPPAPRPKAPTPRTPPLPGSFRVLVVDDNEDIAEAMAMALSAAGYEVSLAFDGIQALEVAARETPQVVILDLGLPGIDGFEVARRLRADARTAEAMLVALSGYGQASDRARSREAGVDEHLVKPVDFSVLLNLLALRRDALDP